MGSRKIININGIEVDRSSHQFDVRMRETEPIRIQPEILQLLNSENLRSEFPDGFLIYMHKTKNIDTCKSILKSGLRFYEKDGGLQSTMSKVYDSKSKYKDGDERYLFNCINEPNQYGSQTVLAIFGRKESEIFSPYPDCLPSLYKNKEVSPSYIIGYVSSDGTFNKSEYGFNLLTDGLSC